MKARTRGWAWAEGFLGRSRVQHYFVRRDRTSMFSLCREWNLRPLFVTWSRPTKACRTCRRAVASLHPEAA